MKLNQLVTKNQLLSVLWGTLVLLNACNTKRADSGPNAEPNAELTKTELRGIVVYPSDLISLSAEWWITAMKASNLNLLGIHTDTKFETIPKLKAYLKSEEGRKLQEMCDIEGIYIEFETHALQDILPRSLFLDHPEFFRMDSTGQRQQSYNMCFSSEGAYGEIEKKIDEITKWLRPSTSRYFFWTDDVGGAFCHCGRCSQYSPSEQALIFENRLVEILTKTDPRATVAHLAYHHTLQAPLKIKPVKNIFLEYAPISREYNEPLSDEHLKNLKNNLKVFPTESAHILEYWLDVSMFSEWKKDRLIQLPWNQENCERDISLYRSLGVNSITSFGAWINKDYIRNYGEDSTLKILEEYGSVLNKERPL